MYSELYYSFGTASEHLRLHSELVALARRCAAAYHNAWDLPPTVCSTRCIVGFGPERVVQRPFRFPAV
jgi:hypothetical protein